MPRQIIADVDDRPLGEVLFLFRQRPRLVRDFTALDDALPRRLCVVRALELRMKTRLRVVVLNVPIGGRDGGCLAAGGLCCGPGPKRRGEGRKVDARGEAVDAAQDAVGRPGFAGDL